MMKAFKIFKFFKQAHVLLKISLISAILIIPAIIFFLLTADDQGAKIFVLLAGGILLADSVVLPLTLLRIRYDNGKADMPTRLATGVKYMVIASIFFHIRMIIFLYDPAGVHMEFWQISMLPWLFILSAVLHYSAIQVYPKMQRDPLFG